METVKNAKGAMEHAIWNVKREEMSRRTDFNCDFASPPAFLPAFLSRFCCALAPLPILDDFS